MQYQRHTEYRSQLTAKLARLADLLDQWEAWDAEQHLPPAQRRVTQPPISGRESLSVLHRAALAELHDLDGAAQSPQAHSGAHG
jgi:hypothetical protein